MIEPLLECRGLRKTFNPGVPDARPALAGLDLVLGAEDFAVVIGGNGAGKSTLMNVIDGSIRTDEGQVVLKGRDLTALPTYKRAKLMARVFQDPMAGTAAGMTIEENLGLAERRGHRHGLAAHLNSRRRDRYRAILEPLNLGLENRLGASVALLSGGQRQALSLMMAVISRPELLLLDEHTAALDPRTADLVMQATVSAIREYRVTTIMITHNMQQAIETGNRLLMMDAGRIVLDLSGEEKRGVTQNDLVEKFKLNSDRALLAG